MSTRQLGLDQFETADQSDRDYTTCVLMIESIEETAREEILSMIEEGSQ